MGAWGGGVGGADMTLSDSATLAEAKRRPPRRCTGLAPHPAPSAEATISNCMLGLKTSTAMLPLLLVVLLLLLQLLLLLLRAAGERGMLSADLLGAALVSMLCADDMPLSLISPADQTNLAVLTWAQQTPEPL